MSKRPGFILEFPEGDDNSYAVSTRVSKGGYQFILDFQSEFDLPNKAQALRMIVEFGWTWMAKIAQDQKQPLSARFCAEQDFDRVGAEIKRHRDILTKLHERLALIAETDDIGRKQRLEESAKKLALSWGIPWPPPDAPLTVRDPLAAYYLSRILYVLGEQGTNRITLRDLVRSSRGDTDEVELIVRRLAEEGLVELQEESRSGPLTLWIYVPSYSARKRDRGSDQNSDRSSDQGGNQNNDQNGDLSGDQNGNQDKAEWSPFWRSKEEE